VLFIGKFYEFFLPIRLWKMASQYMRKRLIWQP